MGLAEEDGEVRERAALAVAAYSNEAHSVLYVSTQRMMGSPFWIRCAMNAGLMLEHLMPKRKATRDQAIVHENMRSMNKTYYSLHSPALSRALPTQLCPSSPEVL